MRYIRIFCLILGFALSCTSPKPQKEFSGDHQFRTTDPSRLYFNNIRSTHYYRQATKNKRGDIYRNRKLSFDNKRPILHPVIVNNWMSDEAYIFIEKNDYVAGFSDTLTVRWSIQDSLGGFFELPVPSRPKMYEFAGKIYESMKKGHKLEVKNAKGEFAPLLENLTDKSAFQTTMRDYYRLTEVY